MPATERRDLRTGATVWEAFPLRAQEAAPHLRSQRVDVAVIGAGITGALVAETTTALGLSTLILERRAPAKGSTAASTALLQFEIDKPLLCLADEIGFETAARAWRRSYASVLGLAGLVASLGVACAFRPRRSFYLAGDVLDAADLAREAELRRSIGLPSDYVDEEALRRLTGVNRDAAISSGGAADLNPVQLTHGLLRVAVERGARLHAPVELAETVRLPKGVGLATASGAEIEAGLVVFATGYELADGVPAAGHRRLSTWAFATPPQPQAVERLGPSVVWEASDPYLYVRSTADGRIVVGGEDEDIDDDAARDALTGEKVGVLQTKAAGLLPWADFHADYCWAGTFGESETGLPSIGPVPGMPRCYAILGYGGNGTTFSYLAAQLLRARLTGQADEDAEIFAFR